MNHHTPEFVTDLTSELTLKVKILSFYNHQCYQKSNFVRDGKTVKVREREKGLAEEREGGKERKRERERV